MFKFLGLSVDFPAMDLSVAEGSWKLDVDKHWSESPESARSGVTSAVENGAV
jgi:hypothetical protein